MSRIVSRPAIIRALLKKELKAYARDKVYLFLTLLVLIAIPIAYTFLPSSVDETITLAVSPSVSSMVADAKDSLKAIGATDEQLAELDDADLSQEQEGLLLIEFDDEEDMQAVVEGTLEAWQTDGGDLVLRDPEAEEDKPEDAEKLNLDIGIAFPKDFIADITAERSGVTVTVYSDANVPEEIQGAMTSFVREAAYQLAGQELPVTMTDEAGIVLGTDRAGDQVSLKDKLRPMLIFMVLLMETFSMASLISTEVLQRTVTAVLVTPAKTSDFLIAKTIFGTLMSLGQGLIVLLLVGGLTPENWSLVLAVLLIGSMMFTGVALFVGSSGRDFMGQLFYSMVFVIPLLIPSFSVMFPGTAAAWVKVLPTYPIINTLVGAFNYGMTWSDAAGSLAYAVIWLVVLFGAGLLALKRKVESL
ncbi:MAG: ABC transporter permease [Coriobacteriia bacterium]|nr:ABC transporter permease [Coriobacteriia bacterium]MBN2822149.1 ABC transporter permease [Coriobacteriia bacterium]